MEERAKPDERLWARLRAQPDRAPEVIALAAARRFASPAEHWARRNSQWRSPDELARASLRNHVRMASVEGAAFAIPGVVTAAADLVALVLIQSRMVFFVAAALGYDPHHPMRPAELLALQGVYETPAEARAALDGTGKRLPYALAQRALIGRDERLRERLLRFAGKRLAERYGGRLVPLLGAPIGAVLNAAVTRELGERAIAYYAGAPAVSPPRSPG